MSETEKDFIHADKNRLELEIKKKPAVVPDLTLETADEDDSSNALIHDIQQDATQKDRPEISVSPSKDENSPGPPDGGYGWFIVLGSFIMHILIGGLERSEGVFFLQFQAKFHQSAQLTAWPGAISGSIRLLVGPIATAISSRYSIRTCCMIGSTLQFIGFLLNSCAPNFYFLFISHALLTGFGRGLLYAPSLIIVNMYFDKKRSLSVGLAASGVGVGSFLIVPLSQLFFDLYGFSGAFLTLAGITFHSFFVAMLFRPLSLHHKFTHSKSSCNKEMSFLTNENQNIPDDTVALNITDRIKKSDKSAALEHKSLRRRVDSCKDCLTSSFQICFPKEKSVFAKSEKSKNKIFHFYLLKDPSFLLFCISILLFTAAFKSAFTFVPALVKSKGYTDTEATLVISIVGVADTISRILSGFLFDLNCLHPCRTVFYNFLIFALAVISFLLPSLVGYVAFCIVMSFYGSFSGAYISQKSVMVVDILGAQNIAFSFGMLVCFQGVGSAFGPPLSGAFKDAFGSFTEAFYFGGALMFFAGIIMISSNVVLRAHQNRDSKVKVVDKE